MFRLIIIRCKSLATLIVPFVLVPAMTLSMSACGGEQESSSRETLSVVSYPSESFYRVISAAQLKQMLDAGQAFNLVDIRSVQEYLSGHVPGALSIPYAQLPYRYRDLDALVPTVVYCRVGVLSISACRYLAGQGFSDLYSLDGGMSGWEYAVELGDGRQVI